MIIELDKTALTNLVFGLNRGFKVKVKGLGIFEKRVIKARKLYHNFSGKTITIPKHSKIHFKPSLKIKKQTTI